MVWSRWRLEKGIWDTYVSSSACWVMRQVWPVDCTDFIRFDYCTEQSVWDSDRDYANIKDISWGCSSVPELSSLIHMQTLIMHKTVRKRLLFYVTIVIYPWAVRQKKMLWVITSLGWNGNCGAASNYSRKVWMVQYVEYWWLQRFTVQWNGHLGSSMASEILRQVRHSEKQGREGARGQPRFSSCLPSDCCEACLLLVHCGGTCCRTGQEQN